MMETPKLWPRCLICSKWHQPALRCPEPTSLDERMREERKKSDEKK